MNKMTSARNTVAIITLGCRSNQYDSSAIREILEREGFIGVSFSSMANTYIINTCTVTGKTEGRSRQLIRKARRVNPDAIVIVTGCYAQVSPVEASKIEGVDYVLGNPEKTAILECIRRGRQPLTVTMVGAADEEENAFSALRAKNPAGGNTRANLKVQDGCGRVCSFCIIPRARGTPKSLKTEDALKEIDGFMELGFKEVVVTGIHLGAYGSDLTPGRNIVSLLKEIEKRNYPARFRTSSLDPDEVTDELVEFLAGAKTICNHLHLPLQSGDNAILRAMRRPYTAESFAERVMKLHQSVRDISIGADVITGFPGEGEKESMNTLSLIKDLPLAYLHVFPYSKRKGTPAAAYKNQVSPREIKRRSAKLLNLDKEKRRAFFERFSGKEADVLVESGVDRATGMPGGRSSNYIQVFISGARSRRKGEVVRVRLHEITDKGMVGKA